MKRSILTAAMILGLAATSAFAGSTKESKQGSTKAKPAAAQPAAASTGGTMAAGTTHKKHHRRKHHKAVAQQKAKSK